MWIPYTYNVTLHIVLDLILKREIVHTSVMNKRVSYMYFYFNLNHLITSKCLKYPGYRCSLSWLSVRNSADVTYQLSQ